MGLSEMRVVIARLIPHLTWRHHGIGCLQAYIRESTTRDELRVHVWHPDLMAPGIEDSGSMHDHRFDLTSTILHGFLEDTRISVVENPAGAYQKFAVINARAGDISPPEPLPGRFDAFFNPRMYERGDEYIIPRREFHKSRAEGLTVTLVSKSQPDASPAIILAPYGSTPVHAFADPMPSEKFPKYLDMAVAALGG